MKRYIKCKWCKKLTTNRKFCCRSCAGHIFGKKVHKLYPNMASMNGKKAGITNKQNKTGAFHNKKIQSKAGKIGGKKATITKKRNKLGWFNSRLQREMGKRGGAKTAEILRRREDYYFKNLKFASMQEREIGASIWYQFERLKRNKNFQIKVGNWCYDFLVSKCFIEYHPKMFYDKETPKEYYKRRRRNLNKNGYKDYNFIVIK